MSFIATAFYLGQRIEEVRKAKRISQGELAKKVDCSRRTIIELEKGGNVSIQTVFRVLAALGLAMDIMDRRVDYRMLEALQEHEE